MDVGVHPRGVDDVQIERGHADVLPLGAGDGDSGGRATRRAERRRVLGRGRSLARVELDVKRGALDERGTGVGGAVGRLGRGGGGRLVDRSRLCAHKRKGVLAEGALAVERLGPKEGAVGIVAVQRDVRANAPQRSEVLVEELLQRRVRVHQRTRGQPNAFGGVGVRRHFLHARVLDAPSLLLGQHQIGLKLLQRRKDEPRTHRVREHVDLPHAAGDEGPDEIDEIVDDGAAAVAFDEPLRLEVGQLARGRPSKDKWLEVRREVAEGPQLRDTLQRVAHGRIEAVQEDDGLGVHRGGRRPLAHDEPAPRLLIVLFVVVVVVVHVRSQPRVGAAGIA
mmetsp:Transcript_47349/g.139793  ORF Transcript_47349/g.139793 Transcript_47349/m.139793 type:complete len:336 (+) Transcript_47349:327-1334(+)